MKKISQLFVMFVVIVLLLWAVPFFKSAISAPTQAIDALEITKSDGVSQVTAGDGVTYTYVITLTNPGPSRTRSVVVTDTWPNAFTRGTVTTSKGSCNNTSTGFTCDLGTVQSGRQVTITAPYTVPPGTPAGNYTNTAVATAEEGSSPVTASDETSVVAEADVSLLSKLDDPDPVLSGAILTYNLSVTNFGSSDASEVVLTDNLPAGIEYQDSLSTSGCSGPLAGPVTCPLGLLTPGSNREVEIKVLVTLPTAGTIHNTASVSTSTTDPDTGNNVKDQDTTVVVVVDLEPPVVSWILPVTNLGYYDVICRFVCPTVHLQVNASDDVAVERVYFKRWDHVEAKWVEIGNDFIAPYTWEIDTKALPFGINQIYAQAYDTSDKASEGQGQRIFLDKPSVSFMPIFGK